MSRIEYIIKAIVGPSPNSQFIRNLKSSILEEIMDEIKECMNYETQDQFNKDLISQSEVFDRLNNLFNEKDIHDR